MSTINNNRFLSYQEIDELHPQLSQIAAKQFAKIYKAHENRTVEKSKLHFGEEIEWNIFSSHADEVDGQIEEDQGRFKVLVNGYQYMDKLNQENPVQMYEVKPEAANWSVELLPEEPKMLSEGKSLRNFIQWFRDARTKVNDELLGGKDIHVMGLTVIPNQTMPGYFRICDQETGELQSVAHIPTKPEDIKAMNPSSESSMYFDLEFSPKPKVRSCLKNFPDRRGDSIDIDMQLFHDTETKQRVVKLDNRLAGFPINNLQFTYEMENLEQSEFVYDSFIPLTPILGPLTNAFCIWGGMLMGFEDRWKLYGPRNDTRNSEERDPSSEKYIACSRYHPSNLYVSRHPYFNPENEEDLNDGPKLPVDEKIMNIFRETGMSERLSYNYAVSLMYNFIVAQEGVENQTEDETALLDQSCAKRQDSLKFKHPLTQDADMGWRVEYRSLHMQLTDYENSIMEAFITLLTKMFQEEYLNTATPMSQVEENIESASHIDARSSDMFWFPNNARANVENREMTLQTIEQIFCGSEGNKGLLDHCKDYLDERTEIYNGDVREDYTVTLKFIEMRAKGEIMTGSEYMRNLVLSHPLYEQDSMVGPEIIDSIYQELHNIQEMKSLEDWRDELMGPMPQAWTSVFSKRPTEE